jgi:hypothetical protein
VSNKRRIGVVLHEEAARELAGILGQWLKRGDAVGAYVNCKEIDPNGPYFHMTLEMDSVPSDFEVQIPHSAIKAIICSVELKKLGFV